MKDNAEINVLAKDFFNAILCMTTKKLALLYSMVLTLKQMCIGWQPSMCVNGWSNAPWAIGKSLVNSIKGYFIAY